MIFLPLTQCLFHDDVGKKLIKFGVTYEEHSTAVFIKEAGYYQIITLFWDFSTTVQMRLGIHTDLSCFGHKIMKIKLSFIHWHHSHILIEFGVITKECSCPFSSKELETTK